MFSSEFRREIVLYGLRNILIFCSVFERSGDGYGSIKQFPVGTVEKCWEMVGLAENNIEKS